MKAYLDSSSFAKRFIEETGSQGVEKVCTKATELGLSVLCVPELLSALNRRLRERAINKAQYNSAKRRVIDDVKDADIINLTPAVIACSITILESTTVRTLDALHVACAVEWQADLFVSSDKQQLLAAKRAGLRTQKM
jgi:uncharacterized protein